MLFISRRAAYVRSDAQQARECAKICFILRARRRVADAASDRCRYDVEHADVYVCRRKMPATRRKMPMLPSPLFTPCHMSARLMMTLRVLVSRVRHDARARHTSARYAVCQFDAAADAVLLPYARFAITILPPRFARYAIYTRAPQMRLMRARGAHCFQIRRAMRPREVIQPMPDFHR